MPDSLSQLKNEASKIDAFLYRTYRSGDPLTPAFAELRRVLTEVGAAVRRERRRNVYSRNKRKSAFVQEQRYRLQQAKDLFQLQSGMSTHETVLEMRRGMLAEARMRDGDSFTENPFASHAVPHVVSGQPSVNNFYAIRGGTINYNVNDHTTNTNSGHTTTRTTIASSNRF